MLVVKKPDSYQCKNEIALFFRGHNIIEYKNPKESYGINDFYKTLAYAGIYQSNTKREAEIDPLYETTMDVLMRANDKVYKEAKNMCQALRELFADELEERENDGRNLINRLNQTLIEQGLFEELKKATLNPAYQQELLKRYELI